jgi:hypothetical protein
MTVPSREEAVRLLLSLDPPMWHLRHSSAVAEVAAWLAHRIARSSPERHLDRRLVETAALLHDVDKALPKVARPPLRHGAAGSAWLAAHGHGELVEAVSLHPVTRLVTDAGAAALGRASLEARIVAYADKRARQRVVSMADRFERWTRRHQGGWSPEVAARIWERAQVLETEVCGLAGCRPEDVTRLGWTGPVLAAALAAGPQRPTVGAA